MEGTVGCSSSLAHLAVAAASPIRAGSTCPPAAHAAGGHVGGTETAGHQADSAAGGDGDSCADTPSQRRAAQPTAAAAAAAALTLQSAHASPVDIDGPEAPHQINVPVTPPGLRATSVAAAGGRQAGGQKPKQKQQRQCQQQHPHPISAAAAPANDGVAIVDTATPMGRVLVATRDFAPGDTVLVEEPTLVYAADGGAGLLRAYSRAGERERSAVLDMCHPSLGSPGARSVLGEPANYSSASRPPYRFLEVSHVPHRVRMRDGSALPLDTARTLVLIHRFNAHVYKGGAAAGAAVGAKAAAGVQANAGVHHVNAHVYKGQGAAVEAAVGAKAAAGAEATAGVHRGNAHVREGRGASAATQHGGQPGLVLLPPGLGAAALFALASKMEHSCAPNVRYSIATGAIVYTATAHITAGQRVCASYISGLEQPRDTRRAQLLTSKAFSCCCTRCEGPDHVRPLPCPSCGNGVALRTPPEEEGVGEGEPCTGGGGGTTGGCGFVLRTPPEEDGEGEREQQQQQQQQRDAQAQDQGAVQHQRGLHGAGGEDGAPVEAVAPGGEPRGFADTQQFTVTAKAAAGSLAAVLTASLLPSSAESEEVQALRWEAAAALLELALWRERTQAVMSGRVLAATVWALPDVDELPKSRVAAVVKAWLTADAPYAGIAIGSAAPILPPASKLLPHWDSARDVAAAVRQLAALCLVLPPGGQLGEQKLQLAGGRIGAGAAASAAAAIAHRYRSLALAVLPPACAGAGDGGGGDGGGVWFEALGGDRELFEAFGCELGLVGQDGGVAGATAPAAVVVPLHHVPVTGFTAVQLDSALIRWPGVVDLALLCVSSGEALRPLSTASLAGLKSLTVRERHPLACSWGQLEFSTILAAALQVIDVSFCASLTSIDALRSCVQLRCLRMAGVAGASTLLSLGACSQLEELWMAGNGQITGLAPLKACPKLCKLDLRGCRPALRGQVEDLTCFQLAPPSLIELEGLVQVLQTSMPPGVQAGAARELGTRAITAQDKAAVAAAGAIPPLVQLLGQRSPAGVHQAAADT
ncbi:hypothetical protein FOA52_002528 [Chlamydomonas sp. UWO 241]|nr:hypothetical protein FOA52_002528 [Chlamydomonas sp. UWO 241]